MHRAFQALVHVTLIGLISGLGWASTRADAAKPGYEVKPTGTVEQPLHGMATYVPVRPYVSWGEAHRWMRGPHPGWLEAHRSLAGPHPGWLEATGGRGVHIPAGSGLTGG